MAATESSFARELYFDYQATTPVDPAVAQAMRPFFEEEFGNAHSGEHLFGRRAHDAVSSARGQIGTCVGCEPEDIVFTSGATEANNLAIIGAVLGPTRGRDVILVSAIEHASVSEAARASNCEVISIPVDRDGMLDIEKLQGALSHRVLLVSVGLVNNEIGTIQNISAIGHLAQSVGALVHTDAAQALPAIAMRLTNLPVDFASLSSHKAYGPKGIGALYVAAGRRKFLRPLLHGGGQEGGLRAGTLPTALCVGFGSACNILSQHGAVERLHVTQTRDLLLREIRELLPNATVVGSIESRHPGNLSLMLPVGDARDVVERIQSKIACSTGSACHSGSELPSHVLLATGMSHHEARKVIRLGVGRFTTAKQCRQAAEILATAVREVGGSANR